MPPMPPPMPLPVYQQTDTDCFRCCIATLMGWPYDFVPDFMNKTKQTEVRELMWHEIAAMDRWFAERDKPLALVRFPVPCKEAYDALHIMAVSQPPGVAYMIGGMTRKGVAHCWIARDGFIVFDPAQPGQPIYAPFKETHFMVYFVVEKR